MFQLVALALVSNVANILGDDCNLAGCHQMCLSHNCTRGDCVLDQCACFGCAHHEMMMQTTTRAPEFWCNQTVCQRGCEAHQCNIGKCRPGGNCACFDCNHTQHSTNCRPVLCKLECMLEGAQNATCDGDNCVCSGCNDTLCDMLCGYTNHTGTCVNGKCQCNNQTVAANPPDKCHNCRPDVEPTWNCSTDMRKCTETCHQKGCRGATYNASGCHCYMCPSNIETLSIKIGGCLESCNSIGCKSAKCTSDQCSCVDCQTNCNGTSCSNMCLSNKCYGGSMCVKGQCNCNGCFTDTALAIPKKTDCYVWDCERECGAKKCGIGFCWQGNCTCTVCEDDNQQPCPN